MEQINTIQPGVVNSLFQALEKEVSLCEELVSVLEDEKEALIAMDMQELIRLSGTKQSLTERISFQDKSIRESILSVVDNSEDTVVKLSSVEPVIGDDDAITLRKYRENLASLKFQIEDRNLVNRRFAEETLHYIGDAISMITGAIAEHTSYESRGNNRPSTPSPALISREV